LLYKSTESVGHSGVMDYCRIPPKLIGVYFGRRRRSRVWKPRRRWILFGGK